MYVLPLIEVQRGETTQILRTPSLGEARTLVDPAEVVQRFAGLGAQGFHFVDVDAARSAGQNNDRALATILAQTMLPVVGGGGVRHLTRVQALLDSGCRRVLVGSMGALHQDWLREAAKCFPERLVGCVDTRGSDVVVNGRSETASTPLEAHLRAIDGMGLDSIHLTYLGANGGGPELAMRWARALQTPVSFQGTVGSPKDLDAMAGAGVRGVVLGREIYDGTLSFEALAKQYRTH